MGTGTLQGEAKMSVVVAKLVISSYIHKDQLVSIFIQGVVAWSTSVVSMPKDLTGGIPYPYYKGTKFSLQETTSL